MRPARERKARVASDGTPYIIPVVKSPATKKVVAPASSADRKKAASSSKADVEALKPSGGADEWDIEFEEAPTTRSEPSLQQHAQRRVYAASPLDALPLSTRELQVPASRRRMLAVLSGQLPPPGQNGSECLGLEDQWRTLRLIVSGTLAGEGNSALLVGAPGNGKDMLLASVLRSVGGADGKKRFNIVRLDAARQETDRQSLRELARQLVRAGAIRLPKPGEEGGLDLDVNDEEAAAEDEAVAAAAAAKTDGSDAMEIDEETVALQNAVLSSLANTTSTILTLLSSGETSSQSSLPLIIVLSSFELYTTRPRQALLYVLLDAVQAGSYTPGLCVIGTSEREGTTDLLEKRVRSRFSGRTINVWADVSWSEALQQTLLLGLSGDEAYDEAWKKDMEEIRKDKALQERISADKSGQDNTIRGLYRFLFPIIASISVEAPSVHNALRRAFVQFKPSRVMSTTVLDDLTMPEFALLVAAKQLLGKDREVFNFAMAFDELKRFVARIERDRAGASSSTAAGDLRRYTDSNDVARDSQPHAPQRSAGMTVNVAWSGLRDRRRVMMAFRTLLSLELFQPEATLNSLSVPGAASAAARRAAQTVKTDFVRVKCTLFPQEIVTAAKSKRRADPLNIHLVQWAVSQS